MLDDVGTRPVKALTDSLSAARIVFRNRDLARVELSWAGSMAGEFLSIVALGVYAYEAGGAAAVGLVGAIQLAPRPCWRPSRPCSATACAASSWWWARRSSVRQR
jgi:hypothetical protein